MFDQIKDVVRALGRNVGTPVSRKVVRLVEQEAWAELQQLSIDPRSYAFAESYWRDNLLVELLRKCKLPSGIDTEEAAKRAFWTSETQNCSTNVRLSRFIGECVVLNDTLDERVSDFISHWRKEIRMCLGSIPQMIYPVLTTGATYADAGCLTTIPDKMSSVPTFSGSRWFFKTLVQQSYWFTANTESFVWVGGQPMEFRADLVRGNKFFTVPKDGKTDRGCCKEPSLNVAFQRSVGVAISDRLLRIGIDIPNAQFDHRALAQIGSRTGEFATIDMSRASDTLCRVLPQLTLPGEWWDLVNSLRSPMTLIDGKWVRLEKFSSMGNGFTFELETLLFATLARTVVSQEAGDPDRVSCFGDDLIVPTAHAKSVVAALEYFGFTPNSRKTFLDGPFRESCGGDFFEGTPVRAVNLEEIPDEPQKWIALANNLRRVADANSDNNLRWSVVADAWHICLGYIPSDIRRCRGPSFLGDIVIHDPHEGNWDYDHRETRGDVGWGGKPLRWHKSWGRNPLIRAYVPVATVLPWEHWRPIVHLASALYGLSGSGVTPRRNGEDVVGGYTLGYVNSLPASAYSRAVERLLCLDIG